MVFHVALVPVGKLDGAELEEAASRVAKLLRQAVELRDPLSLPHVAEDPDRHQHRASTLLERLRTDVAKLKPGKLVGAELEGSGPPPKPEAFIFVTDVDLYTAKTSGVLAALNTATRCAVVSVRRLREAFYRRRADPVRQRSRLVKEILRMIGRLAGLPECPNPACLMAPSRGAPDIDSKSEQYCRDCAARLFERRLRI